MMFVDLKMAGEREFELSTKLCCEFFLVFLAYSYQSFNLRGCDSPNYSDGCDSPNYSDEILISAAIASSIDSCISFLHLKIRFGFLLL